MAVARGLLINDANQVRDAAGGMAEAAGRLASDAATLISLPARDSTAVDARGAVRQAAAGDVRAILDDAERRLELARFTLRDARLVLSAHGEAEAEAAGGVAYVSGKRALQARLVHMDAAGRPAEAGGGQDSCAA